MVFAGNGRLLMAIAVQLDFKDGTLAQYDEVLNYLTAA